MPLYTKYWLHVKAQITNKVTKLLIVCTLILIPLYIEYLLHLKAQITHKTGPIYKYYI